MVPMGGQGPESQASREELSALEAERRRRLAPENRPEHSEVDNTDASLPTVDEFNEREAAEREDEETGTADPTEKFRQMRPSDDEVAEIEAERRRRLAPETRPEHSEVDNTGDSMPDIARDENQPE